MNLLKRKKALYIRIYELTNTHQKVGVFVIIKKLPWLMRLNRILIGTVIFMPNFQNTNHVLMSVVFIQIKIFKDTYKSVIINLSLSSKSSLFIIFFNHI